MTIKLDPKKVFFVPYSPYSEGLGLLVEKLGLKSVKVDGTSSILKNKISPKFLIFWGKPTKEVSDQLILNIKFCYLNHPSYVQMVVDKRKFFSNTQGQPYSLEYTTVPSVAYGWLEDEECKVVARETATGSGGQGISILKSLDDWDNKKKFAFFTKYIPKKAEYRVHVFNQKVIAVSRKVMRQGEEPKNGWEIRSHDNGFIFQNEDPKDVPKKVLDSAINCCILLGMHFGGVDVIWNDKRKQAYVCEINSAPGIEGSTVDTYAKAIEDYIAINFKEYLL